MSPPGILGDSPPASFFQLTRISVIHPRLKPRQTRRRAGKESNRNIIILSCICQVLVRNHLDGISHLLRSFWGKSIQRRFICLHLVRGLQKETTSEQPWRPLFRHRWPAAQPNALSSTLRCLHLGTTVYMPRRWQYDQYFSMTAGKCRIIP